ncbi:MAG: 2-oxoglutarate dehydrogenase E1 component [Bacteroidales bacterium]|nr:2-oxoglutarate dehydrogenase E1 component [Bacteroidales bacterium]
MHHNEHYVNNLDYIEELFTEYQQNPNNVDSSFRYFFDGYLLNNNNKIDQTSAQTNNEELFEAIWEEFKVIQLIDDYRKRGHLFTETNPVRKRRSYYPTLDLENYGLQPSQLNKKYKAAKELGLSEATLEEIIHHLKQTYCRSIGVEYMYIRFPEIVSWFKQQMEPIRNTPQFDLTTKTEIYKQLVKASFFEQYLHKKFVGQKRFSLEGVEAILPALHFAAEFALESGTKEITLGMAHRGRLTVLANFFEKPLYELFEEYLGKNYDDDTILGDVKYHLGYHTHKHMPNGKSLIMSLLPNPSHLETVGPVSLGFARARIDHEYQSDSNKLLPIIIHGDAAIAAQGIVYETAQMSLLEAYGVGGTLHFVLNNQVGFTTNYIEGRSSIYATDIAKITHSPIFHVNADDPEAIVYVVKLAIEFRNKFHRDVYIDILGYRKHGHNEGDEPRFTQPTLYKAIESHPSVREIYFQKLVQSHPEITNQLKAIETQYQKQLDDAYNKAKTTETVIVNHFFEEAWKPYSHLSKNNTFSIIDTSVDKQILKNLAVETRSLPTNKKFFSKTLKIINDQLKLIEQNLVDWSIAEQLAFATLIKEGYTVRLSGQDSVRGTFNQRHAAWVVEDTDEKYYPLYHLKDARGKCYIYNSLLSEYAVLGFEYGYSLANPNGLTIWEAQFGDFHNVAQVIIDQYISSAKDKWGLMSGLTLFLPHGYEGQGPEHSSARIERFLVLAANENMFIANVTTPANLFHILRRQVKAQYRLPLILFTPKSTLRHPKNISTFDELATQHFKEIIDDSDVYKENVKQIILCSGKIYFDLYDFREKNKITDTAIIRIEQIYPLHKELLLQIINNYPKIERISWVQEEPANMGAWFYMQRMLSPLNIVGICRPASGSTAIGLYELHKLQHQKLMEKAFQKCTCQNIDEYCYMSCTENK